MILLASGSASRRAMLEAAGVAFEVDPARVDEASAKAEWRAGGGDDPCALAETLAALKATEVSRRRPERLVIGGDSVMALADGSLLDKPGSRAAARAQLLRMRGGRHRLVSAIVAARGGEVIRQAVDVAILQVRAFSDAFLDTYLDAEWPAIGACVGCFRIEGRGVQLFDTIEGSQFTILGMPLMPLLAWLREAGELPA